jgi:multisubunit Na+/H+ antiporter MnhF subunit
LNEWEILAAVLAAGLGPCVAVAVLGSVGDALIALEIAGVLVITALLALAEGLQRQPFVDLALVLAPLSLIGTLVIARLLERELEDER